MHPHNTPNCVCERCGKPFRIRPAKVKMGRGRYCSVECRANAVTYSIEDAWQHVDHADSLACWEWQGTITQYGYGQFKYAGKTHRAHRVIYELTNGPIPDGFIVRHKCDNRRCVNPAHLELGTHIDNMADMRTRGRSATGDRSSSVTHPELLRRGIGHHNAKLTDSTVVDIHRMRHQGLTIVAIADVLDVSRNTVANVVHGRTWKHVKPPQ